MGIAMRTAFGFPISDRMWLVPALGKGGCECAARRILAGLFGGEPHRSDWIAFGRFVILLVPAFARKTGAGHQAPSSLIR